MPIYEYECKSCGYRHEALQKMSDDPLTDCPDCDKSELKKLISAAAFRLKGGGWYETDFKNSKDKKKNIAGGSDSSSGSSSGSSKGKASEGSTKSGSTSKSSGK